MTLGAQLVGAAGLDFNLLSEMLTCPEDAISLECVLGKEQQQSVGDSAANSGVNMPGKLLDSRSVN